MSRLSARVLFTSLSLLAAAPGARAAIISVQVNPPVPLGSIDFDGDGRPDIAFCSSNTAQTKPANFARAVTLNVAPDGAVGTAFATSPNLQSLQNTSIPAPQAPGRLIGPGDSFSTGTSNTALLSPPGSAPVGTDAATGNLAHSSDGHYIGLSVVLGDGQTHYAWVQYQINPIPGTDQQTYAISGYAYESTPNVGIPVGAVPEPSSACVIVLGAIGMCLRRKEKARRVAR